MKATFEASLRTPSDSLPEVVLVTSGDNALAQRVSRLAKRGRLRQLYRGVYSSNLRAEDQDVVARNWSQILAYLAPGAVISHRSSFDGKPHEGTVYVSRAVGRRDIVLPGLRVKALVKPELGPVLEAPNRSAADVPYNGVYLASQPRAFLENLTADKRLAPRQLARQEIEAKLDQILALRGPQALNALRDGARAAAGPLKMQAEFRQLDAIIGALLGTRHAARLSSARALARAQGRPYDAERVALFERVAAQLKNFPFADIAEPARQGRARDMFAFVESYFSNYIEGTTFTVDEANEIIFAGKIIPMRTEDSHDIKGSFEAAQRDPFYSEAPTDEASFLAWLRRANAEVMRARPEKEPGQWKSEANQAGNTLFVLPELVPATLQRAWPLLGIMDHPMQKALFSMFVVSEVHPFADGNGRAARLLMNCFLSHGEQCRIIVPTIFRDDYLLSLKAMTHQSDADAYIRAMRLCQAWSNELDYDVDVPSVNQQLIACNAVRDDSRAYRLLSPRTGQLMSVPETSRPADSQA